MRLDLLSHGFQELRSIGLPHGLVQVHGIWVGAGGEGGQWKVVRRSRIVVKGFNESLVCHEEWSFGFELRIVRVLDQSLLSNKPGRGRLC